MRKISFYATLFLLSTLLITMNTYGKGLSEKDLEKKKEGWYPTGLPLINYNSDDGIGYGLRGYIFYNGKRDDKYFDTAPYFLRIYAQYFSSTTSIDASPKTYAVPNGIQVHELNVDAPYIMKTKFRVTSSFVYWKEINANYFTLGKDASDKNLTDPAGNTYDTYKEYEDKFLTADKNNLKYNKYSITKPSFYINIYRDLTDIFKLLVGMECKKATVDPWDGNKFEYEGDEFRAGQTGQETLLEQEKPIGYKGGWSNFARFGIAIDTRDFEPDPNNGVYIDYAYEIAGSATGSDYNFNRSTATGRLYHTLIDSLVIAMQGSYTDASGDVPFYEMSYFGFAFNRWSGLGGNRTLRGFKKYRFVGKTMTLGNLELRWEFAETTLARQFFAFKLVGFVDTGNVYDEAKEPYTDPRWDEYKTTVGGGLVIAWNQATIVHFFYGKSKEDQGIYVNFMYNF